MYILVEAQIVMLVVMHSREDASRYGQNPKAEVMYCSDQYVSTDRFAIPSEFVEDQRPTETVVVGDLEGRHLYLHLPLQSLQCLNCRNTHSKNFSLKNYHCKKRRTPASYLKTTKKVSHDLKVNKSEYDPALCQTVLSFKEELYQRSRSEK